MANLPLELETQGWRDTEEEASGPLGVGVKVSGVNASPGKPPGASIVGEVPTNSLMGPTESEVGVLITPVTSFSCSHWSLGNSKAKILSARGWSIMCLVTS